MKRLPSITSFILFIVLSISVAYWSMRMFKPPQRAIVAPPLSSQSAPSLDAAAGLFGGRSSFVVTSNFQLTGVIVSDKESESVAILAVNGKSAQAVRTNEQVVPGVTVKEVHRGYVLLLERGVVKRVELPENAKARMKVGTSANPIGAISPPAPVQTSAGISTNPINGVTPVPRQMQADKSANATKAGSPPAALPDPSYGSSLLGKYYSDRNAKLRNTPPPNR